MILSTPYIFKDHSDKQCLICLSKFKSKERVTQLACLHIYHEGCDPSNQLSDCPKCRTPIKERLVQQIAPELLKRMSSYAENYDRMLEEVKDFKDKKFNVIKEKINSLSLSLIGAFLHDYPINMRYYSQGKWHLVNPDLTPESVNFPAFYKKISTLDASSRLSDPVSCYVRQVLLNFIDDERVRKIYDQNTKLTKQTYLDGIKQLHAEKGLEVQASKSRALEASRFNRSNLPLPLSEVRLVSLPRADDNYCHCLIPAFVVVAALYVFNGFLAAAQPRYF